jgi:hypothetical protein
LPDQPAFTKKVQDCSENGQDCEVMTTLRDPDALARQPLRWPVLFFLFALLALTLMIWRWGGTIEDSQAYYDTARYFRGEVGIDALRAPFPYRTLVPAIAAMLPGDLRHVFAGLNWMFMTTSACFMMAVALRAGLDSKRAIGAGVLMLVALPTFWYAPYLLVDPGSICARSAFVLAVLTGQPWLAALAGLAGTAVREENILLLVWLLATRRISVAGGLAVLAAAGAWLVAVRFWLIPGLPSYTWAPSWWTVNHALHDLRSIASIVGTSLPIVPLAVMGWSRAPASLKPLRSLLFLMALPPLYAALCVRVEGRIIWGLYPFLIPFAVASGRAQAS